LELGAMFVADIVYTQMRLGNKPSGKGW
jgi:hypothetical protein